MGLPVTQTHPTKIMLAVVTLHVVAAAILLNTYVTFGTLGVIEVVIR